MKYECEHCGMTFGDECKCAEHERSHEVLTEELVKISLTVYDESLMVHGMTVKRIHVTKEDAARMSLETPDEEFASSARMFILCRPGREKQAWRKLAKDAKRRLQQRLQEHQKAYAWAVRAVDRAGVQITGGDR